MPNLWDFFSVRPARRSVKYSKKRGVLFSNPTGTKKALFYVGNAIFLGAIGYVLYLYWPISKALVNYWQISKENPPIANVTPTLVPTPMILPVVSSEFMIKIPRIGAQTTVVANVSASNSQEYLKVLETDVVAQAKGSDLPGGGINHTTYIFAHSTEQGLNMTRKNAVFYLLGELVNGDEVQISYHGQTFAYRVYKKQIVNASQIEFLTYKEKDKEVLILQTCWPLGTDWKRLLVFAQRVL